MNTSSVLPVKSLRVRAIALLFSAGAAVLAGGSPAGAGEGWHTLSGRIEGTRGRVWRWGFDLKTGPEAVVLRLRIHPVAASGVSRVELERALRVWEPEVERIWSRIWAVELPGMGRVPVVLDLDFAARGYHHEVAVCRGGGRVDSTHWRLHEDPAVVAHEVGHMLGLYDEYRGGAHPQGAAVLDPDSVMASGGGRGKVRARHLGRVLRWIRDHVDPGARLVAAQSAGPGGETLAEAVPQGRYGQPSRQRGEP